MQRKLTDKQLAYARERSAIGVKVTRIFADLRKQGFLGSYAAVAKALSGKTYRA